MKLVLSGLLLALAALPQTFPGAADLDAAINQAIREDKIPGAVVLSATTGKWSIARPTATARWFRSKSR